MDRPLAASADEPFVDFAERGVGAAVDRTAEAAGRTSDDEFWHVPPTVSGGDLGPSGG